MHQNKHTDGGIHLFSQMSENLSLKATELSNEMIL